MSPEEFARVLGEIGINLNDWGAADKAAAVLNITKRQVYHLLSGHSKVSGPTHRLLSVIRQMRQHGFTVDERGRVSKRARKRRSRLLTVMRQHG